MRMNYQLALFDDFHLHGASAPEWKQRYLQMTRGEMRSSLTEATAGSLHVFRKWMSERVVQQGCLPAGKICFGVLHGDVAGTPRIQGREIRADSLFVLRGDDEFSLQRPKGMELLAVTFDSDEFLRLLDERPLSTAARALLSRSLLRAPLRPLQRLRRELLRTFQQAARRGLAAPAAPATLSGHPVASQIVAQTVFDVLEGATGSPQTVGSASASALVARCHHIVASCADEPPSIEALCQRLKTSRRTLQNSFRQVAETTPVHYLRSVRLDAVRRQLLSTRSSKVSVAQAAMSRGFTHLSHFAEQYKELFGELPSETLRLVGKDVGR